MKKASTILFILSLLFVILAVSGTIYAIYDIAQISNNLANDPSASGIDFMGIGWGYGIILFVLSTLGLILSAVTKKVLRYTAVAEIAVSAVLIIVSIFIFYV